MTVEERRHRDRLKKLRSRGFDPDLMERCEATTHRRNGNRQCPFLGYYDPVEEGYRCQIHEARS